MDISENKYSIKKGDIVIILSAIFLAGIAIWIAKAQIDGELVLVMVNGNTTEYSLLEDQTISLVQNNGQYNTIIIKQQQVFMKAASCPDQICVYHKKISKNGESIICLPNQIFVEVISKQENDIDN